MTPAERWVAADPAGADHDYLVAHRLAPHDLRQEGETLLIPAKDIQTHQVVGVQLVGPDGTARIEGRVAGAMTSIGASASKKVIYVCASWAVGAQIHLERKAPVAVAIEDTNVPAVASAMRRKYPKSRILVVDEARTGLVGGDGVTEPAPTEGPLRASDEGWPARPRLPGPPEPERLPMDVLPLVLAAHVESVAQALQVPAELPGLLALACVSAAVAGRVEVQPRVGWREPVGIYTATILPPGSRKSPTYEAMTRPLRDREAEIVGSVRSAYLSAIDAADVARADLDAMKKAASKGKATRSEVEGARMRLSEAEARIPPDGRLLVGDVTPEALVQRLAAQGGRAAVLEPEPGPLQVIAGRYSDNAQLGEINKAWSGEDIIVDRVGRSPLHVRRPALTLGVLLQPDVLEGLPNAKALRAEGTIGRVLWCRPPHGLGSRLTGAAVPPLDEAALARYERAVRRLIEIEIAPEGREASSVHVLSLDPDALRILHAYEAEVEEQLADGGRYASIRDWAGKMVGQALRLAALLELAARAGDGRALVAPVGPWAMTGAVRLVRALASHALCVLDGLGADPRTEALRYLLKRLQELNAGITESELRDSARRHRYIEDAEDLADLLDELERRGCVRRIPQPHSGPGRPPSPVLELHPQLRAKTPSEHPENPGKGLPRSREAGFGDLRDTMTAHITGPQDVSAYQQNGGAS